MNVGKGRVWGGRPLFAIDENAPVKHDLSAAVAGVIAFYPFCYDKMDPSVPALVMIGEKDDWMPAADCQAAAKDKPGVELVVYPGLTHAFAMSGAPPEYLGHHMAFDEHAAADTQQRADAFMAAHMK